MRQVNLGLALFGAGALVTIFALETIIRGLSAMRSADGFATAEHCSRLNEHERRLRLLEISALNPPAPPVAGPGSGEKGEARG